MSDAGMNNSEISDIEAEESGALFSIIKNKIKAEGTISIMDYMHLALGHPEHGYYMKHNPFGARGDFITAPEISQIFGEMIGIWVAETWRQMGKGPLRLVECGPGRGTLMADLLRATKPQAGFHESLTIHMVETSPSLANAQYLHLRELHERIEWIDTIEEVPEGPVIIIANEFFDALPIRQYVMEKESMRERRVGLNKAEDALEFVLGPAGLSLAKSGTVIKEGTVLEHCPAARNIMQQMTDRIATHGGAMLVIDYGFLGEAHQDTLQAVKQHQFHPVLKDPGNADITAHVDFASLQEQASEQGLFVPPLATQGVFLRNMGGEVRLKMLCDLAENTQKEGLVSSYKRLTDKTAMGDLFKVMAVSSQAPVVGFDEADE
jgi:NADH dehydrogenase [ubiquinone] 1 alpha subcomplex assembly factor 7